MGLRELGSAMSAHVKTTLEGAPETEGESCANASFMNNAEPITVADRIATVSLLRTAHPLESETSLSPFPGFLPVSYERMGSPGRSFLRVSPLDGVILEPTKGPADGGSV